MLSRLLLAVLLLTIAMAPRAARAQRSAGFADDRFEPAGAGSEWLAGESLDFDGHRRLAVALVDDWAWKPIVAYDAQGTEIAPLVSQQLVAHMDAALVLWNRVRVDLNLPVTIGPGGSSEAVNGQSYASPDGSALGDVRLGGDVRIFGHAHGRISGAAGLQIFLPTGRTQSFSSDGGFRLWPRVMVAGERGRLAWAARLGVQFRPHDSCACTLAPGSEVNGALAVGWRATPRLLLGPELFASSALAGGPFAAHGSTPVEVLLGGHLTVARQWNVSLGVSRGVTNGAGAPALRGVLGVQYAVGAASAPALAAEPPPWTSHPSTTAASVP